MIHRLFIVMIYTDFSLKNEVNKLKINNNLKLYIYFLDFLK